jgi:magnesium chelatase subunit I
VVRGGTTNDIPTDLPPGDLATLLRGEEMPDPLRFHISPEAARAIMSDGLDTPVEWMDGTARSRFITATPDTTVKDLVGYVDAIKVARRGIEMYRIESYSAGHLMQSKHGIFCIDELPVLDPRKQVALLSVLQEDSFTTGTYRVIFEPRLALLATANPVDYTHSGRIIEPLHDRLASHIRTRYPSAMQDEARIILQEASLPSCVLAGPMLELLAGVVRKARSDDRIDQEKGVSVRSGIHGLEVLVAEAARVRPAEPACPRPSDMGCLEQAVKVRLAEMDDTIENRARAVREIAAESLRESYAVMCPADVDAESISSEFAGKQFAVSQLRTWDGGPESYREQLRHFPALGRLVEGMVPKDPREGMAPASDLTGTIHAGVPERTADDGLRAVAVEVVLECLRWRTPPVLERREDAYGPL